MAQDGPALLLGRGLLGELVEAHGPLDELGGEDAPRRVLAEDARHEDARVALVERGGRSPDSSASRV